MNIFYFSQRYFFPLLFVLFAGCFSFPSFVHAFYAYEGEGFYAIESPNDYIVEGTAFYAPSQEEANTSPIYRFYNRTTGDHIYTISQGEKEKLERVSSGYTYEGIVFYAHTSQENRASPVYRFYNRTSGDHFYTTSLREKESLQTNTRRSYAYEGIAFYAFTTNKNGTFPVYRFYNPRSGNHFYTASESEREKVSSTPIYRFHNPRTGNHFYTASLREKEKIQSINTDYLYEGIGFYAFDTTLPDTSPVYRFYNKTTKDHFYTTSLREKEKIEQGPSDYAYEGIGFYAYTQEQNNTSPVHRFYNRSNGDHFYTTSLREKGKLLRSELGPDIAVGLWKYTENEIKNDPFEIRANKPYTIKDKKGNIITQVHGDNKVKVTYSSDVFLKVYDYNKEEETRVKQEIHFEATDGNNFDLIFDVHRPSSSFDNYRGKIHLQYTDKDNIWVINTLPMEHYVWGMGETTGTGDIEHTKVMTTLFRTYGDWYITYATKYLPYGFQIRSDSGSQIYYGYEWEQNYVNITKAAQATRGVVATYKGEIALTPYSSWSDGRTRSFQERWGSDDYPWCQSVKDPYGKHPSLSTQALEDGGNHMVGLIANGSLNLATDHDWDYQRIMKYYYTGIDLNTEY